jgi:putative ABC transport system ATP-binding protein
MNMFILEAYQLTKQVNSPQGLLTIVDRVDCAVVEGESVAIVGSSGAGKSTLLALLAGLDEPTQGEVRLMGESLTQMNEDERALRRASHIGFVFQSFHLLPGLTALENVLLPLELAGYKQPRPLALAALDEVGLSHRMDHYPKQLSGGEQQRVAIARAMVHKPKLLFADEPTGNLDEDTGEVIMNVLFRLNREHGVSLLMITHNSVLADRCDRRLSMSHGRLGTAT